MIDPQAHAIRAASLGADISSRRNVDALTELCGQRRVSAYAEEAHFAPPTSRMASAKASKASWG
jgi:hypothetical protein